MIRGSRDTTGDGRESTDRGPATTTQHVEETYIFFLLIVFIIYVTLYYGCTYTIAYTGKYNKYILKHIT